MKTPTFESIHKPLWKWIDENFEIKRKNKEFTKYMGPDFGMAVDMNISDTFNDEETLKYYLEEADGPDFEGYNIPMLLVQKILQYGITHGQTLGEQGITGLGIKDRWNKNIDKDK